MNIILGYSVIIAALIVEYAIDRNRELESWLTAIGFVGLVIMLIGVKQLLLYNSGYTFGVL